MVKANIRTLTQARADKHHVEKDLIMQARHAFDGRRYKKSLRLYRTIAFVCDEPYASEALYWIGCHYEYGLGVKQDKLEAAKYYKKMVILHKNEFLNWSVQYTKSEGGKILNNAAEKLTD